MIFASVGSMLPFDRLVRGIDDWAAANPSQSVFIQIGDGEYTPQHAPWARMMPQTEYRERLINSVLFVAHAGMGSILQALELRKQTLLLPRRAKWREHTTDHQLHTAEHFKQTKGLKVVDDVPEMHEAMSQMVENPMETSDGIPPFAPDPLIQNIRAYLTQAK